MTPAGEAAPWLRALDADLYTLQECNLWELLGRRRLHQASAELDMSCGFLAEANATTADHRFHTAMLFGPRWQITAEGAERNRYHHVLGADPEHPKVKALYEAWGYRDIGGQQPFPDAPIYATMVRPLS